MLSLFATRPLASPALQVGQLVHVNVQAIWFPAEILSIAHTQVLVSHRAAAGASRVQPVAPWSVRPATGIFLRRVQELRCEDQIVAFDGSVHTLTDSRPARDRRWLITYANGVPVSLPPRAVLRVRDTTPEVTVNGVRL